MRQKVECDGVKRTTPDVVDGVDDNDDDDNDDDDNDDALSPKFAHPFEVFSIVG